MYGTEHHQNRGKSHATPINFLFRACCVDATFSDTSGRTSKHQASISRKYISLLLISAVSVALTFGYYGHYTRKVTIKGILAPQQNTVHAVSPANGVIQEVFVQEGDFVAPGQRIARLSRETFTTHGPTFALTADEIKKQIQLIEIKRKLIRLKHDLELQDLSSTESQLKTQILMLTSEVEFQQTLVKGRKQNFRKHMKLTSEGAVSLVATENTKKEYLEASIDLQRTKQALKSKVSEYEGIGLKKQIMTTADEITLAGFDHEMMQLNQDLLNNEASKAIDVVASIAGTISAINTSVGQHVLLGATLASAYPAESYLQAILYIPPESVGFVERGQNANVRVSAFPFQKFGGIKGTIIALSQTPYQSGELPAQLTDAIDVNRTYYKAIISLKNQNIKGDGQQRKLLPGLIVEADLMLERRRLYEWLLSPLYAFTKKTYLREI
ncbi:HlyD family efflux transporter periplasmic adaptor subunit [Pseudomonas sp. AK106]